MSDKITKFLSTASLDGGINVHAYIGDITPNQLAKVRKILGDYKGIKGESYVLLLHSGDEDEMVDFERHISAMAREMI